jgi:hypothetical protein
MESGVEEASGAFQIGIRRGRAIDMTGSNLASGSDNAILSTGTSRKRASRKVWRRLSEARSAAKNTRTVEVGQMCGRNTQTLRKREVNRHECKGVTVLRKLIRADLQQTPAMR